jgi:fatty acid desaturase
MAELGKRHRRDALSLVFGLLMLAVATLFLASDAGGAAVDLRWLAPVVLIGIGLLGLLASTRPRGGDRS